jgi:ATP-dependent Clp protease ATP-binding subunit ClpB
MGLLNQLLDPTRVGSEAVKLDSKLRERIVGQEQAIQQIVHVYQTYLAGMSSPGRPIGNLLFLGPTGSGKTRTVEAVAESLVGDARAVIKVDCAEFSHSHEIAKLIGSPPGYLGHRETHPLLSQETLNQHHTDAAKLSFVWFDEIEKASDSLWSLLLGIMDKGILTLGDNRRVDFSRSMIFLTSNLGATQMNALLRPNLGFAAGVHGCGRAEGIVDEQLEGGMASAAVEAARRKFTPEFLNRIDKVVVFQPLGSTELRKILALELNSVQRRVLSSASEAAFVFTTTESAREFLMREGTDLRYGARHLKRAIDRNIVHALSNLMATEQVRGGDVIRVDYDYGRSCLTFIKEAENMSVNTLLHMVDYAAAPPAVTASSARTVVEIPKATGAKSWRR